MASSPLINRQQQTHFWIVEAVAYLLALCLHVGLWHMYKQSPKPLPPQEPPVIEVALLVKPKPALIAQPQVPATPPPPAPAPPKPQPIIKPLVPKPLPKPPVPKAEKPEPKKPVEKVEPPKPKPKPKPVPTERPVYKPDLEEEPETPAPEPVREAPRETHHETHHEPPPAPPRHRDTEDEEGGESHQAHKAKAADKGEDTTYHPGGMSGFKRRYPHAAQERGWEGTVTLKVHISADGDIGEVIVVNSSGHDVLDEAAVDMIKDAHATPARRGDKPVDSWVVVPYRFTIPK